MAKNINSKFISGNYVDFLDYDSDTGIIFWKKDANTTSRGKVAGYVRPTDGYCQIVFKGKQLLAHRIAWELYYGEKPAGLIDHINMNRSDNRISNLRLANIAENNRNKTKQSNNTSGYKGVSFCKTNKKYVARINKDKKGFHLGSFDTAIEAHIAYVNAAGELHGKFART